MSLNTRLDSKSLYIKAMIVTEYFLPERINIIVLNAVTVKYLIDMIEIIHILHYMISGAQAFLDIAWIISHIRAT